MLVCNTSYTRRSGGLNSKVSVKANFNLSLSANIDFNTTSVIAS